jgi:uncharacterized protein
MDDLIPVVYKGDAKKLLSLLRKGADPNRADRGGRTALMNAAIDGKEEMVRTLLQYGADPNIQDRLGYSALHFASQNFHVATVELFLNNGAQVNVQDNIGNTPLFRAVMNSKGRGDVIRLLLKAGADRTLKNKHGNSAEDAANTIDNYDIKQFFK